MHGGIDTVQRGAASAASYLRLHDMEVDTSLLELGEANRVLVNGEHGVDVLHEAVEDTCQRPPQ